MILDKLTEFCDAVSVAASAGTALVGSQIDASVVRDLGNGRPVYLVITCDTAIITGGSAGLVQFSLASDSTASISTSTSSVHLTTPNYVTDDTGAWSTGGTTGVQIAAGDIIFCGALPSDGQVPYEKFLGILCTTTTTTTTAGKINAFLTLNPVEWKSYADGI